MFSNSYLFVLKFIIVVAFSYSTFRLYIAPNSNKDLHLSVVLTCAMLAVMFFNNGKTKYTRNANRLKILFLIVPLSYTAYRLLLAPNDNRDAFELIWMGSIFLAMLVHVFGCKKEKFEDVD